MKKTVKVLTSMLLVASMSLSLTGCFFGKTKAVKEAAEEFMEAALEREFDDMADLCTDDDAAMMYFEPYGTDFEPVEALLSRATFKVNKVTVNKEKATAEIVVSFPDYEAAIDSEPEDMDEFEDLLDDQKKTIDMDISIEFKLKKDEWLVNDYDDFAEDFYGELYEIEFGFMSEYEGWVQRHNWYGSTNEVYSSTRSSLNLELYITSEHYYDTMNYYFKVFQGTNCIYTSDRYTDYGFLDNYCYLSTVGQDSWEPGNYTFTFYDSNNTEFYSATCSVE